MRQFITTEYLGKADTSVEVYLVNNSLVFVYNKDGYTSFIVGIEKLHTFLKGDTSARYDCCDMDNGDDFSEIMGNLESSLS